MKHLPLRLSRPNLNTDLLPVISNWSTGAKADIAVAALLVGSSLVLCAVGWASSRMVPTARDADR
jgi:hypothetical protein